MAYTTLAAVKEELDISTSADDALIATMITQAENIINWYTRRTSFEAVGDITRFYDSSEDTSGKLLYLDQDLADIPTTVTVNGAALTYPTDYVTVPRNQSPTNPQPYYALKRVCDSAINSWCGSSLGCTDDNIEVTGEWVFSLVVPEAITRAATMLVSFYYRKKDSQIFDTVSVIDTGVIAVPNGIPVQVANILQTFRTQAT